MRTGERHQRHHPLPQGETVVSAGPELIDHPGGIHTRYERRPSAGHADRMPTGTQQDIGRTDRGGVHPDTNLTRTRLGFGQLQHPQNVRAAELVNTDRLHAPRNRSYGPGIPVRPTH